VNTSVDIVLREIYFNGKKDGWTTPKHNAYRRLSLPLVTDELSGIDQRYRGTEHVDVATRDSWSSQRSLSGLLYVWISSSVVLSVYRTQTVAPRPTQPSIHPGSVNEYQLRLGRQWQVWFIPLADERGVCR